MFMSPYEEGRPIENVYVALPKCEMTGKVMIETEQEAVEVVARRDKKNAGEKGYYQCGSHYHLTSITSVNRCKERGRVIIPTEEEAKATLSTLLPGSKSFNAAAELAERKRKGQYMTPREVSEVLIRLTPIKPGDKVLDPAVGTGELLTAAREKQPDASYEGWDIDPFVMSFADQSFALKEKDFLTTVPTGDYDVIIANPPYFEMKLTPEQKAKFKPVLGGRVNIFTLFFYQSLLMLKEGGHLGFIVPPSMNNGAFFKNLRTWLMENASLLSLEIIDGSDLFADAQTSAQVIVFQRTSNPVRNKELIFTSLDKESGLENSIFTRSATQMREAWEGKKSLWDLGYVANTGAIPWNQVKDKFVENGVPLVYSKDINSEGRITWHPQYDDRRFLPETSRGIIRSGGVVVNRITGTVGKQRLKAAEVRGDFIGENHVNVISRRPGVEQEINTTELVARLSNVSPAYLALLTGNTQISAKELSHHIPL